MYNTLLKTHSQLIKPEKCGIKISSRCVYRSNTHLFTKTAIFDNYRFNKSQCRYSQWGPIIFTFIHL